MGFPPPPFFFCFPFWNTDLSTHTIWSCDTQFDQPPHAHTTAYSLHTTSGQSEPEFARLQKLVAADILDYAPMVVKVKSAILDFLAMA